MNSNTEVFDAVADIVKQHNPDLTFTLLEIGARPTATNEAYYQILAAFPASSLIAIEVDKQVCAELNNSTPDNIRYYPVAIGKINGDSTLYETVAPVCTSLYKPNEQLLKKYNNLQMSFLKQTSCVETITLDTFISQNNIGPVDFMKLDIQGAELDAFTGGENALQHVLFLVSEVEFVHLYDNQPLFGDVHRFLLDRDFMLHKFINIGERALSPCVIGNNINAGSQILWSDAIFIKDLHKNLRFTPVQFLKMGLLAILYQSIDLAYYHFSEYDLTQGTNLKDQFINLFSH